MNTLAVTHNAAVQMIDTSVVRVHLLTTWPRQARIDPAVAARERWEQVASTASGCDDIRLDQHSEYFACKVSLK